MKLDDTQRQKVSQWIEEGLSLSKIQDKLASEFGLRMTYMEVRFLIDDLALKLKDAPKEPPAELGKTPAQPSAAPAPKGTPAAEDTISSGVSVTVDQVTRPGSLVSGKVKFSDGKTAEWYLDQMGRLGMVPPTPGYRPPEKDVAEFQIVLEQELVKLGL